MTNSFDERLKAFQVINSLMNDMARRYSFSEMEELWDAMDTMRTRYGDIFVADAINKDRKDAELALFRYVKTLKREKEEAQEQLTEDEPEPRVNWHKAYPTTRRKGILKKLAFFAVGTLLALVLYCLVSGSLAIERSQKLIDSVDKVLEMGR